MRRGIAGGGVAAELGGGEEAGGERAAERGLGQELATGVLRERRHRNPQERSTLGWVSDPDCFESENEKIHSVFVGVQETMAG